MVSMYSHFFNLALNADYVVVFMEGDVFVYLFL